MPFGVFWMTWLSFMPGLFSRMSLRLNLFCSMSIMSFMPEFMMLSIVYSIRGRPIILIEDLWLSSDRGQKRLDLPAQRIIACVGCIGTYLGGKFISFGFDLVFLMLNLFCVLKGY